MKFRIQRISESKKQISVTCRPPSSVNLLKILDHHIPIPVVPEIKLMDFLNVKFHSLKLLLDTFSLSVIACEKVAKNIFLVSFHPLAGGVEHL